VRAWAIRTAGASAIPDADLLPERQERMNIRAGELTVVAVVVGGTTQPAGTASRLRLTQSPRA
jgi:hypothetical protein